MNTLMKTLCALCVLLAGATVPAKAELPDITITDITLNSVCKVVVTMQNLGPGSMPASAFVAGSKPLLAVDVDGVQKSYGQYSDPSHALEHPGGTLNSHPSPLVLGQHTITARYDPTNMLNEANEGNNNFTQVLTGNCPQLQPDLALTQVRFMPDCRAVLELRNAGSAPLQDSAFLVSGVKVRRTIDGIQKGYIALKDMDPGRVLQPPGGILTWQEFPEFIGQTNVRYEIDPLANETNTANNLKIMTIPTTCGTKTLQKIAPTVIPGAQQKPLPTKTTTSPTAPSSLKTLQPVVPTKLPVPPPQPVDKKRLTK
mgnify:CR=1 FL=1